MKFWSFINFGFSVVGIFLMTSCAIQQHSESQQTPARPGNNETLVPPIETQVQEISKEWDETVAKEFLTISELKTKNPGGGIYETEGYIVSSVSGCNCPVGLICNCPIPHIVISMQKQDFSTQTSNKDELIIWENLGVFDRDRSYRFKVEVRGAGSIDRYGVTYVAHKLAE